jgi:hypothetical protein
LALALFFGDLGGQLPPSDFLLNAGFAAVFLSGGSPSVSSGSGPPAPPPPSVLAPFLQFSFGSSSSLSEPMTPVRAFLESGLPVLGRQRHYCLVSNIGNTTDKCPSRARIDDAKCRETLKSGSGLVQGST